MQFSGALNQLLVLFLVIIIGYIATKWGYFDEVANKKVSRFVIKITLPAIILSSVMGDSDLGSTPELIQALLLALGFYLAMIIISLLVVKSLRIHIEEQGLYRFMIIFSNIVFIGFPVVRSIYGEGAIFYASIFNLPFNLIAFTYGLALIRKKKDLSQKINLLEIMNSAVVAGILAIFIFIFKLKFPAIIVDTMKMVGGITTPMSLIIIGASLAAIPIKEVFRDKKLYLFALIKLLIIPVLLLLILKPFVLNKMILGVMVILAGMPVASVLVMLCKEYGIDSELATKATFITTLFSVVTIPVLTYLLYTLLP